MQLIWAESPQRFVILSRDNNDLVMIILYTNGRNWQQSCLLIVPLRGESILEIKRELSVPNMRYIGITKPSTSDTDESTISSG